MQPNKIHCDEFFGEFYFRLPAKVMTG